jgi:anti-anti-sigma factor
MLRAVFPANTVPARANLPPPFACAWRVGHYGSIWVDLAGELDLTASSLLAQTLQEAQARASLVVLDLRELTFIGVAGVHVIVDAGVSARQASRGLIVARGSPEIDSVFSLTGTCEQVELFDLDPEECPPALRAAFDRRPARAPPRRPWREMGSRPPPGATRPGLARRR